MQDIDKVFIEDMIDDVELDMLIDDEDDELIDILDEHEQLKESSDIFNNPIHI